MLSSERKSLKSPDEFVKVTRPLFSRMADHPKIFLGILVALVAVSGILFLWKSKQDAKLEDARDALYKVQEVLESESQKAGGAGDFKALDVKVVFPGTVSGFEKVAKEYSGTRIAFEANLSLGKLFHRHGQSEQAISYFLAATNSAPQFFEKAGAFTGLAAAYENTSKFKEAIQAYEKVINLGLPEFKSDALLGIARSHEAQGEKDKAKEIYDRIIKEMPDSSNAKLAKLYKNQL